MSPSLARAPEIAPHDPAPSPSTHFEFAESDSHVFAELGRKMRFVGAFFVLAGVLRLLYDALVAKSVHLDITFVIDVLIGVWTLSAARSFRRIASTQGHDHLHLMLGLRDIAKLYSLLYWLLVVMVILGGVLLLVGLTAGDLSFRIR